MEMCGTVILGVWKNNKINRIKLENVNLESNTEALKNEALTRIDFMKNIELVYRGLIFENGRTLSSYGVTPGCTIHVLEKHPVAPTPEGHTLSQTEIDQLVASFKPFKMSRTSAGFRTALQRLSRPEVLENIIAATPGLANDPIALAIIQDPELLIQMAQPETIAKVAEKHPTLIEAAHYIAAHIHDEQANLNPNLAGTSTGYSYSLDALSDDEDMEGNMSDSREVNPLARNSSFSAITSAQLAAAIASATAFGAGGVDPLANTSGNSAPVITNEMFSNAIQQAFASSPLGNNPRTPTFPLPSNATEDQSLGAVTTRWQSQLQQMREMGLLNDSINIRALQTTSGDVQAAIELVFNGVFNGGID